MEEKLNLILKVLALRLRLDYGFTRPEVEELVKEIDQSVMIDKVIKAGKILDAAPVPKELVDEIKELDGEALKVAFPYVTEERLGRPEILRHCGSVKPLPKRKGWPKGKKRK